MTAVKFSSAPTSNQTPSIAQPQQTVTTTGENTSIEIKGRHDPVIVPRAVVVVESMAAITLVDAKNERTDGLCEGFLSVDYEKRR